jgi:hypothetical protein
MEHIDGTLMIAARHGREIASYHIDQGDSNDCGPHVVAMAVNFWRGRDLLQVDAVARAMNRPRFGVGFPPLVVRRIPNWATLPWGIADMLRQNGFAARWRLFASEDTILRALREDRLVMPIYGEPFRRRGARWTGWSHVAILCGWSPDPPRYLFVDSSASSAPSSRPREDFLKLWRNMGRLMVEIR